MSRAEVRANKRRTSRLEETRRARTLLLTGLGALAAGAAQAQAATPLAPTTACSSLANTLLEGGGQITSAADAPACTGQ